MLPKQPDMRRRAREIWDEEGGKLSMPKLAERLELEGFRANAETLRKWRLRDKWATEPLRVKKPAAIRKSARQVKSAARQVGPPRPEPQRDLSAFLPQAPTLDDVIGRLMRVCDGIGIEIEAALPRVNAKKPADIATLAGSMRITAEAAAILQEAALRARGLSAKDIKALDGMGNPIMGEMTPPASHGFLSGAIEAFRKAN